MNTPAQPAKDLLDLLQQKFEADPPTLSHFEDVSDYLDKFIIFARDYLRGNEPVSHRIGAEGFMIQLQDGTTLPIVDVPIQAHSTGGAPSASISQGGVRTSETTRGQSWGITGDD